MSVDPASPALVMIVEDEMLVGIMLEDYVRELGLRVEAIATSLDEGLRRAETTAADLVILDVNLRGEMSWPIAATLARRQVPFVFSTGYAQDVLPQDWADRPWLQKPYALQALRDTLRRLLRPQAG